MELRLICRTTASASPWELREEFAPSHSDEFFLEYAQRKALELKDCIWFMGLDVWMINKGEQRHLAFISVRRKAECIVQRS